MNTEDATIRGVSGGLESILTPELVFYLELVTCNYSTSVIGEMDYG